MKKKRYDKRLQQAVTAKKMLDDAKSKGHQASKNVSVVEANVNTANMKLNIENTKSQYLPKFSQTR